MNSILRKVKKLAPSVALVLGALTTGAASATVAPTLSGPIKMKFADYEQFTGNLSDGNGGFQFPTTFANGTEDLRGLFQITQILNNDQTSPNFGSPVWNSGDNNTSLWGIFYGFDVISNPGGLTFNYTGGNYDIYLVNGSINPLVTGVGGFVTSHTYTGINTGGQQLWLSGDFGNGVDPANAAATLQATITTSTLPFTGQGYGNLDVGTTVNGTGSANPAFDTNSVVTAFGLRDASFHNDFHLPIDLNGNGVDDGTGITCTTTPCGQNFAGGWNLLSDDPVQAVVPEPGRLALMGLGFLALGFYRRRASKMS